MKHIVTMMFAMLSMATSILSQNVVVTSPNGQFKLTVNLDAQGKISYDIALSDQQVLEKSSLGLETNIGNFDKDLRMIASNTSAIDTFYSLTRAKCSNVHYQANNLKCTFENSKGQQMSIDFNVSDQDVAFRYTLYRHGETGSVSINRELTGFRFPQQTTEFLTPQSVAMIGWKRTKPSYEEEYVIDAPLTTKSKYGQGWTFPCLFKVGSAAWVLVSETGVDSHYCGSHLSDCSDGEFTIAFPMKEENNGNGTVAPAFSLPGSTPWRTIVVGQTLAPIVENTAAWNNVEPLYETTTDYKMGRGTWSWILWQDNSINIEDQKKYIDLASVMGYEYTLVDNWWDTNIGHDGMKSLAEYAKSKNVKLIVWYSSSGYWNDIIQGPVNKMDNPIARKQEMRWLKEIGAAAIKVDFFGGDKQETMRLYEAILSDADDAGLMVIFHGCTLPRGWERMYPNYVGSEAVLASENLIFSQAFCDELPQNACLHPFIRNAVGCMEFGGCFMNKRMSKEPNKGNCRRTSDVFELATTILFQNPIQHFALAPNNIDDAPKYCLDFLRTVPTTWDETRYIAGYPGQSVVLARRHADKWYVAGVNATSKDLTFDVDIPSDIKQVTMYDDSKAEAQTIKVKNNKCKITVKPNGGAILVY